MIERSRTRPHRRRGAANLVFEQLADPTAVLSHRHFVNRLTKSRHRPGRWNLSLAWWRVGLGLWLGAVLALWSFGGPVPAPPGFEDPGSVPRRLLRLAHIALIALPILNLHFVPWTLRTAWGDRGRRACCLLLLVGTVGLPAALAAAAFWPPALYAAAPPALATIAGVFGLAFRLGLDP